MTTCTRLLVMRWCNIRLTLGYLLSYLSHKQVQPVTPITDNTISTAPCQKAWHGGVLAHQPSNSIDAAPSLGVEGNPSVLVHVYTYRTQQTKARYHFQSIRAHC